ncbi:MAG: hypothetical protein IJU81_03105 [Bacteroidales bacterium]|nr:hypothetical protein [Bacteroidales bacterium]
MKLYANSFEPDDNAQKAAVDGKFTYWVSGDNVRINRGVYSVSMNGNDEAAAADVRVDPNNTYMAVYPSEAYVTNRGTTYTVNVPKNYYYKKVGGKQVLDGMPMVAYYSEEVEATELHFGHITAALTVRVKNEKSHALDIDRIELVNDQYRLSGDVTFDITTFTRTGSHAIAPKKTGMPDTVSIQFHASSERIEPGHHIDVQVPIMPVGSDNSSFTINVYCHLHGDRYVYTRTTDSRNNSIGRAALGYAVTRYDDEQVAADLFETKTVVDESGNELEFYTIGSASDLRNLSAAIDSMWPTSDGQGQYNTSNFMITQDIDMQGEELKPIYYLNKDGDGRCYFDGQGHTISNFTAGSEDEPNPECCGLFGKSSGDSVTVRNLNVDRGAFHFAHVKHKIINYDGHTTSSAVGGIYAVVDHAGIVIENCTVTNIRMYATNDVINGEHESDFYASGIVGLVQTSVTIRNCYVSGISIGNTSDAAKHVVLDQFGAAIGRIDVGDAAGHNTYGRAGDNCPVVTIENFTYEQGSTPLVFVAGLKTIRYGGLVANITRGGKLVMDNCKVVHNVIINKPLNEVFCGGLVGCNSATQNWGVYLATNCEVSGIINNQVANGYSNSSGSKMLIEKYVGNGTNHIVKVNKPGTSYPSCSTCLNTLAVTGKTTTFYTSNQHF